MWAGPTRSCKYFNVSVQQILRRLKSIYRWILTSDRGARDCIAFLVCRYLTSMFCAFFHVLHGAIHHPLTIEARQRKSLQEILIGTASARRFTCIGRVQGCANMCICMCYTLCQYYWH